MVGIYQCLQRVFYWNNLNINSTTPSHQHPAEFHHFYLNRKQDTDNNTAHTKRLISFLKEEKKLTASFSKIWENNDGCAKQYICASEFYLMSVMSQCYSVIIDRGISAPGYGKQVVDGLNAVDKRYIYQLMSIFQLPGSIRFDSQMQIHTGNQKYDVSLAK